MSVIAGKLKIINNYKRNDLEQYKNKLKNLIRTSQFKFSLREL
jgi:hypothetical protein